MIARSAHGTREMFVVRRIVQGEGVERKFPLNSPRIAKIVVQARLETRQALLPPRSRRQEGKAVRLKERRVDQGKRDQEAAKTGSK